MEINYKIDRMWGGGGGVQIFVYKDGPRYIPPRKALHSSSYM